MHSPARASAASLALFSGALSGLLLALVAVEVGPVVTFDRTVADGLHASAVRSPVLVRTSKVLTDWVWDPWTMRLLIAAAVVWLWTCGERALAVWAALVSAVGTAVQQGLKALVGRERPAWPDPVDSAHFASFPSGHAMTAALTVAVLLWLAARMGAGGTLWWAALGVGAVSVLGVGLTRLYLGVHWFSDVLAGWLMGLCCAAVAVLLYERWAARAARREERVVSRR
ncbi:phosphatase PAP2 family protein [Streptomyces sp. ODS05-4]|uniref:phosphatase PAP2 family protein n=1 Tax=Streptomyces sp. ODS05-4 TaxID=2944939 RepID=UPI002109AC1F|nr:phosphatase PAP2 family protein [Streptomyces sp. ODS05-4]